MRFRACTEPGASTDEDTVSYRAGRTLTATGLDGPVGFVASWQPEASKAPVRAIMPVENGMRMSLPSGLHGFGCWTEDARRILELGEREPVAVDRFGERGARAGARALGGK